MMRLRSTAFAFFALVSLTGTLGCDKKPKPEETAKSEPTPVPSGIVFNDFLPASGAAAGIGVRDAGGDSGLGGVPAGEEPAAAGSAEGGKVAIKLLEPGAEPRAVRKYAFVANKTDKRVVTITQSVSQQGAGQTVPPQEVTMKLHLDITPKQVKPTGAQVEAKLTKIDVPGAPPQMASMFTAMNGFSATFEFSARGEIGEASFAPTPGMQSNPQMAQQILEVLSRGIELLVAPLPAEPVGVGAKWELAMKTQEEQQSAKRYTLREVSNEAATVDSDIEVKVPRRAAPAPRGGGTMFVEVDGKGHYTQQLRFNQVVTKAEGELTQIQKIEVGEGKGAPKQSVVVTEKSKQVIDTPAAK